MYGGCIMSPILLDKWTCFPSEKNDLEDEAYLR
jgi:hypothetical protein